MLVTNVIRILPNLVTCRHMWTHSGRSPILVSNVIRPHSIQSPSQCDKSFPKTSHLKAHDVMTHSENNKPYICQQCDKSYTKSSHLKAHI
jgi:hypothetical protein